MKKYIFVLIPVLFFTVLVIPDFSLAYVEDIDPNPESSQCVSLENNLRYRSRDSNTDGEVSLLQDFLQSEGYLNNEPTGYFGLLTQKAVKSFQKNNGINPNGYVGPITRAKIEDLSCDEEASLYDDFAKCLASEDLIMYGTSWCSHCISQKELFGSSFKYVPYVECSSSINDSQSQKCINKKISSYPTWIDKNGKKYLGKQTLERLSEISGCELSGVVSDNPYIKILSPNGGETYKEGKKIKIKWETKNVSQNYFVGLELYKDSIKTSFQLSPIDKENNFFSNLFINDGETFVILPAINYPTGDFKTGDDFKIRAFLYSPNNISVKDVVDMSDNFFTIDSDPLLAPFITILSPNGGEEYQTGDLVPIKWNSSGVNKVSVLLNIYSSKNDSYYSEHMIAKNIKNNQKYSWRIPENIYISSEGGLSEISVNEKMFKIMVLAEDNSTKKLLDQSNGFFTIKK